MLYLTRRGRIETSGDVHFQEAREAIVSSVHLCDEMVTGGTTAMWLYFA